MGLKDKILYMVIGILLGAIVTTGVFMIINKNRGPRANVLRNMDGQMMRGDIEPPDLSGATKTITEDGAERYDLPDGSRVMIRKTQP